MPKRRTEDIFTWLEADYILFASYIIIAGKICCSSSYQPPNKSSPCRVWLFYDPAFREKNATATNLTDWSDFNGTLFGFHSTGTPARPLRKSTDGQIEMRRDLFADHLQNMDAGWLRCYFRLVRFAQKCARCHATAREFAQLADTPSNPELFIKAASWLSTFSSCVDSLSLLAAVYIIINALCCYFIQTPKIICFVFATALLSLKRLMIVSIFIIVCSFSSFRGIWGAV